jgi:hypothetical protein
MAQDLDLPALARMLSQLSGDLVLVIDARGLVLTVAAGPDTPAQIGSGGWEGRPWADTVTPETRPKVSKMLQELARVGSARRRELNHPVPGAQSVAFAYHAVQLGHAMAPTSAHRVWLPALRGGLRALGRPGGAHDGLALAMGRDLGPQTALQQRLLAAQQQVEASRWPPLRGSCQPARSDDESSLSRGK